MLSRHRDSGSPADWVGEVGTTFWGEGEAGEEEVMYEGKGLCAYSIEEILTWRGEGVKERGMQRK